MPPSHPQSPTPFSFATKAITLERLAERIFVGRLCEQIIVPTVAWSNGREEILERILGRFGDEPVIVRSSAATEDTAAVSLAGAHLSVVIETPTADAVAGAIDEVFASYRDRVPGDEVLIQPLVENVVISGVVLTRDLDTGGPYYVINYDDFSGRTDTVTGGGDSKTVLVHRQKPDMLKSHRLRKLIDSIVELEAVVGIQELDIEFCITADDDVFILQVRPLAARDRWTAVPDAAVDAALDRIRGVLSGHMQPTNGLAGQTTVFSEMTDWNPAEMIGNSPRPLALSLYKLLITDHVWAEARARMGYRLVDGPLLVDFHGRPFIDVRRSLNSFLPAGTDPAAAGRLVDHQIRCLAEDRSQHDKVEFEIAVTCRDFSFDGTRRRFADAGLDAAKTAALETDLGALTAAALDAGGEGVAGLLAETDRLLGLDLEPGGPGDLAHVHRLLGDCRAFGTLPFSQIARHGFIGVQLLKSLVARGALGAEDMDNFMHGIHTVAADLAHDIHAVAAGTMSEGDFLGLYGHLRPGTYDILSWRYDERPDLYLGHGGQAPPTPPPPFALSAPQGAAIEKLLGEAGYRVSPEALMSYIAVAIEAREQAKFIFSCVVSNVLSALVEWGRERRLSREDLSFLPIGALTPDADIDDLEVRIVEGREAFELTRAIRLPHVILEPADIDVVRLPLGRPTFITAKAVTAPIQRLGSGEAPLIDGRIVLIESADPGFDWIFSHDIRGLITKYGGTNSHMAIRCAEFGLPAAIGCGERLFEAMSKAHVVELNCTARKVSGQ